MLVEVHAAAVNFPDTLMIAGHYQTRTPLPYIPGHEAAGIVVDVGDGTSELIVGDRVAVLAPHAFAEYVTAPAESASLIPDDVDFGSAAATWVCHLTAYHALRSVARISSGERVLVLGAGGGVGLAAVELATALGAEVVAAASSRAKLDAATSRGARVTIDYSAGDIREQLRAVCGPGSLDAVIDPVGGWQSEASLRELRWGGTFVTLGYASGEIPMIPLNLVLLKGAVIKGFEIRPSRSTTRPAMHATERSSPTCGARAESHRPSTRDSPWLTPEAHSKPSRDASRSARPSSRSFGTETAHVRRRTAKDAPRILSWDVLRCSTRQLVRGKWYSARALSSTILCASSSGTSASSFSVKRRLLGQFESECG